MAVDTLPMTEFFTICKDVLKRELRPIHYVELTQKALGVMGLTKKDVNWQRQIEDVREKMLRLGQFESFYIGKPYCLGGLRWWFIGEQLRLFNPSSGIIIPGNASDGADGAFESLMRDPYMKAKHLSPNDPRIARGRASGLVLEKHVAHWFKRNWPELYLPPDNEGKWEQDCPHDFKLRVNGKVFNIDVSGPHQKNGQYGNPGYGKKKVDFHFLCEIIGQDVLWRSVVQGRDYTEYIFPEGETFRNIWPERIAVWLNCYKNGIDYQAIKSIITGNGYTTQKTHRPVYHMTGQVRP